MEPKITLKQAQVLNKMKQFIKERENEPPGDRERFEELLNSAVLSKENGDAG